jgi:hypothetical protein
VPSIDERSLHPVHALLAQHDQGLRQEPGAASPPGAVRHAHPRVHAPELQEARPGARRRGPSAAPRLLQSTQSASTTTRPPEPRSAPWEVALFCAVPDVRLRARLEYNRVAPSPPLDDEPRGPLSLRFGSSRGFTGQGPDGFRHPAPLAAIPRGESFAPTRSARTPRVVSS